MSQDAWKAQIARYGTAVITLLNEIADTYLDEIDWHIVEREENVIDAFAASLEFRWRLMVDTGNQSYFSYDVEALAETYTLGFRVRFIPEAERVLMTGDVDADLAKLREIALKAFTEGRAGTIRVERKGVLSPRYKVTLINAQGEVVLRPIRLS